MSEHGGLLAFLCEAQDIKNELDISFDEALTIQRERSDQRRAERELATADANVVYVNFGAKPDPEAA